MPPNVGSGPDEGSDAGHGGYNEGYVVYDGEFTLTDTGALSGYTGDETSDNDSGPMLPPEMT